MRYRIAALAPFLLASCIYVHHPDSQDVAQKLKTDFQTLAGDLPNGDPVKRYNAHSESVAALMAEMYTGLERVQLNNLPDATWATLRADAVAKKSAADASIRTETRNIETLQTTLANRLSELPGIRTKHGTLAGAMNEAAKNAARHDATQQLLSVALVAVADEEGRSFDRLREVLDTEVAFTEFTVTDGVIAEKTSKGKIGALVGIPLQDFPAGAPKKLDDLGPWGEAIEKIAKLGRQGHLQLRDPGILTTVIGLGLDVAIAEEKRMLIEIDLVKQELKLRKELIAR